MPPVTYTDAVHVRRMAEERLHGRLLANVPQLARFIYGARDIVVVVGRQRYGHHIAGMRIEFGRLLAALQVPLASATVNRSWLTPWKRLHTKARNLITFSCLRIRL